MKVCWITGGGTGIGRALAEALAGRRWSVAISGRRRAPLEETVQAVRKKYPQAAIEVLPGDVSDPVFIESSCRSIGRLLGPVDLLINNAGVNQYHNLEQADLAEFEDHWRINCLGAIACAKAVLPAMREKRSGAIVNISSIYGRWASANSAAYSVSKYAVAGWTDVLRQTLVDSGVRVLGVYPGFIRTAMTAPFVVPGSLRDRVGKTPEQMAQAILRALDRGKTELYYPWYVPWVLRLHRWMPLAADRWARRTRR